jgi:uncharacterized protein YggE
MLARTLIAAALLALSAPALAQPTEVRPISGTRLDVVASGEVTRVPDIVLINAGISTHAPTASEAIRTNGAAMDRMRAALRAAGIAPRDIQTSSVNLNPEWRDRPNAAPVFAGYTASHRLAVRFRDPANAGRILDALVAAGANQIDGPSFEIAEPEAALDEARTAALTAARARADLYASALGMRVRRILAVSESDLARPRGFAMRRDVGLTGGTNIDLGEQALAVGLTVSFELE